MVNRLIEKRIELIPDEHIIGFKSPMKLEYYLIESKLDDMDELSGKKVYGIEIIKKVDGMKDEVKAVKNLSCNIEKTKDLFEKMVKNFVTPIGLPFILDDMIGT
ncbi:MAG: DUF6514 family protein [Clostridia bacterium]|nr:DUF6514 family protein [Clostridia bacterium]